MRFQPVEIGSGLTTPHQVAVDGAGNLYVADSITNEIIEFAGTSTISSTIVGTSLIGGLTGPKGVAVDASGNLYIAETGNVLVQPIDSGMQTVLGSGFTTPVSVAVDASGNVYVADRASASDISFYNRTAATLPAISMERTSDATLTNVGNTSYVGGISSNSDSNVSSDFAFAAGSSNGCNTPASLTLAAGNNCGLTVTANTRESLHKLIKSALANLCRLYLAIRLTCS